MYFTEDGIWTMNDEDGELRLTIMAILAQTYENGGMYNVRWKDTILSGR